MINAILDRNRSMAYSKIFLTILFELYIIKHVLNTFNFGEMK